MGSSESGSRAIIFLTVLATGCLTLFYYFTVNYLLFGDFGFIASGRIVFASKFGYFDYLILPLGLFFGMNIYRKQLSNQISYRQLVKFGFTAVVVASICFSALIFVYLKFIEPEYFYKLVNLISNLNDPTRELSRFKKDMIASAKSIEEFALLRNPLFYAIANFIVYFLVGSLSSLLFAHFFKAKKRLKFSAGTPERDIDFSLSNRH